MSFTYSKILPNFFLPFLLFYLIVKRSNLFELKALLGDFFSVFSFESFKNNRSSLTIILFLRLPPSGLTYKKATFDLSVELKGVPALSFPFCLGVAPQLD